MSRFLVTYQPEFGPSETITMDISDREYQDALRPLPPEREIDFNAAVFAMSQMKKRHEMARTIADGLTCAIIELLSQQDTINGYNRKAYVQERAGKEDPGSFNQVSTTTRMVR